MFTRIVRVVRIHCYFGPFLDESICTYKSPQQNPPFAYWTFRIDSYVVFMSVGGSCLGVNRDIIDKTLRTSLKNKEEYQFMCFLSCNLLISLFFVKLLLYRLNNILHDVKERHHISSERHSSFSVRQLYWF